MGAEFIAETAGDLCAAMYDNVVPKKKPKEEWHYFTFGCGQPHAGYYVKIRGSFIIARDKMVKKYGSVWAFQYSESEWEKMKNDPNRNWKMEKELEVIE